MTTFTGTASGDTADATVPTLTGFTGGGVGQLTDLVGDSFDGQGGNDFIHAGNADDTLDGGADADTLDGGGGSDIYN